MEEFDVKTSIYWSSCFVAFSAAKIQQCNSSISLATDLFVFMLGGYIIGTFGLEILTWPILVHIFLAFLGI